MKKYEEPSCDVELINVDIITMSFGAMGEMNQNDVVVDDIFSDVSFNS